MAKVEIPTVNGVGDGTRPKEKTARKASKEKAAGKGDGTPKPGATMKADNVKYVIPVSKSKNRIEE